MYIVRSTTRRFVCNWSSNHMLPVQVPCWTDCKYSPYKQLRFGLARLAPYAVLPAGVPTCGVSLVLLSLKVLHYMS